MESASSSVVTLEDEKVEVDPPPPTKEDKSDKPAEPEIKEVVTQDNPDIPPPPKICPNCGKEVTQPEMKLIPSTTAWCTFAFLFFCLYWWLSWIPFLCNRCLCLKCKRGVQMCPHCYRRLDRPPV